MRNSRGGARKYPTSVLSDRNEHFVSSMSNQSYFRTYSSNSCPFSSRLGNSVDPTLQQQLINFDKATEELFIQFTQKQRDELNAFDRKWILENGYDLEATSHYLDVRNVEAREEIQRQNECLIRSRARSLNLIKKRQKQELQKFYNQRIRERNEIIESSEIEPSETVMSIVRNRSGVQVFPKTTNFSQNNSQLSTRTKQIKIDIKKQNSKPSFFFSKTKFEGKDIKIGRFKPKKKPKKEEDPNLLDIDNLTRILNAKDSRYQRIKREKELDETCKMYEFGELNTPSGMSSAYISAAGSSDEISLLSSRTNGSTNIAMSAYDLQVEHFMRHEEKTNKEINEFIEKQDILIQRQIQSSLAKKSSPLIKETKNNSTDLTQSDKKKIKININDNQNANYEYDNSDSESNEENQNANTDNKANQNNGYEYEYYSDDKINSNDNNIDKNPNSNQNKLSRMLKSLKPLVDVKVNIFTKGLSSTSETALSSDANEAAQIKANKQNDRPENNNSVNDDNINTSSNINYMKNKNQSALATSRKRSKTLNSVSSSSHTLSIMSKSKNDFSNSQSVSKNVKQIKFQNDNDMEHLSSGRVRVHKKVTNNNSQESSIQISSKSIGEKRRNSNLSNNPYSSPQGKQQFAFRTTLEMGINSNSTSPIKLDKRTNDD